MKFSGKHRSDNLDQSYDSTDLIAVGKVVRAHGVRGEVIVVPLTDFLERFSEMESVLVERSDREEVLEYAVASVRSARAQLILKLDGIQTRNDAESLIGSFLCVTRNQLSELPENDFYQFELIGMSVVTDEGETLGIIAEIMELPANDVWKVEGNGEILLPAIKDVILNVDRKERIVTVHLLEGLTASRQGGDRKEK